MTRRTFAQAIPLLRPAACAAFACGRKSNSGNGAFEPFIHVKDSPRFVLSPDGRFAMVFSGLDIHRFRIRGGITKLQREPRQPAVPFSLFELASGRNPVWQATLPAERPPLYTSFFSDSQRVYAQVPDYKSTVDDAFLIDVAAKQVTRLPRWQAVPDRLLSFHAVEQSDLVGPVFIRGIRQYESWLRVSLPEWTTRARAPYGADSTRDEAITVASEVFTADRNFVIHADGNQVICRTTEDLQPVWSRVIDKDFTPSAFGISPDGRWVGAGFDGNAFSRPSPSPYIAILNGGDGSEVRRIHLPRVEQFCLSPDGSLLAAGQRIEHGRAHRELRVQVFDTQTGNVVADLPHMRIRGRDQSITAGFTGKGLQFTSDGKHLAVAGRDTRIWRVKS